MQLSPRTTPHWRLTDEGLVLLGSRLAADAPVQFPPLQGVLDGEPPQDVAIGPRGTLYTFTTVHPGAGQAPYQLAMADFAPDIRVFARLLAPQQPPAFGGPVKLVPFALPDGTPDYAFETL